MPFFTELSIAKLKRDTPVRSPCVKVDVYASVKPDNTDSGMGKDSRKFRSRAIRGVKTRIDILADPWVSCWWYSFDGEEVLHVQLVVHFFRRCRNINRGNEK